MMCRRKDPQKGEQTMLVKAKWNVKDASGWHSAGEVFQTESNLGGAVEVLDEPASIQPVKEPVAEPEKEEAKAEKPKGSTRRRTTAK